MKHDKSYHLRKDKLRFVEKLRHKRVLTWGLHIPASALPTWNSMPQLAIQLHQNNPKGPTPAKWNRPYFFRKTRILSDTNNKRYMILVTLTSCFSPLSFLFSCRVQRPNELVRKVSANLCVREPKADQSLSNGIPCHQLNHFRQIL